MGKVYYAKVGKVYIFHALQIVGVVSELREACTLRPISSSRCAVIYISKRAIAVASAIAKAVAADERAASAPPLTATDSSGSSGAGGVVVASAEGGLAGGAGGGGDHQGPPIDSRSS